MVVGIKDVAKLVGIAITACCAVLVCTLFLNFYFDLRPMKNLLTSATQTFYYQAQVSTAKITCYISGGCLLGTTVIMLLFYVKHYIDTHKKELGILKALGHSNLKIAKNFWVFGITVFIGAAIGFCGAFFIMPTFYSLQNKDHILPEITLHFHPALLLYLVLLPAAAFAALAVVYACFKLKKPVLWLLQDKPQTCLHFKQQKRKTDKKRPFIEDLKRTTLQTKKSLIFFVIFASFCFASMTQMSASMKDLASAMMGIMILLIGIVLACTTLFLAISTVIKGNEKTITVMRVFGYSQKQCCQTLLGGYRPLSYLGFAFGTVYQYLLLKIMVSVVFKDVEALPAYRFDFPAMLISLTFFILLYEAVMHYYMQKINKLSVKEIMTE